MQTDTETARSLLSGIDDSGLSSAAYARAIRNTYYRGMNGVKYEDTPGYSDAAKLPETQRRAVWEAGKQRRAAKVQEREALIDSGKAGTRESGVTMQESAKSIRNLIKQQQTGMAEAGLHIEVYASTESERQNGAPNGIYRSSDGTIHIDLNAGDNGQGTVAYALAHETTHFIQDYSPAKFETYAELIIAAAESKGISYDSLLARQLARLSEMEEYKNLSETELQDIAYDETIAEMSETILTDTDAANRLSQQIYKQDKTLWQKIKDFFTGLVEKLRNAYKDSDPDSDIGRMLKRAVQDNAEIAQAWAEAVAEAGENYQLQDGQKKNAREGERYSLRGYTEQQKKNWESSKRIVIYDNQEQLSQFISDSIADKTMDKKMYFGAIPADLASRIKSDTGVNVENFNLSLGSYEVRKILKDHGNAAKEAARGQRAIVADDFGHITDIILNPTEITLSNQDYMGKPAIIFSGDHNGRMNVVAVVSDKRLDLFVQTVYTNVKKGNLATPTGEQAPINTPEANSSTVSNNSIRKSSRNVNSISENQTETENFKKWFGDWQNDPAKASKVVNADGTPKVLYHQTSADFTFFEPRHEGAGTRGQDTPFGIFMKSSDRNIGVKGVQTR